MRATCSESLYLSSFWRVAPSQAPMRLLSALLLLGAFGLQLAGCGQPHQPGVASGKLRVGYAVEAPYAYVDVDGRVTGEAPEVARLIAQRLGLGEPLWQQMAFDDLLTRLDQGQIDVIAAGMFITPERARRALFSSPTFAVRPGLLVLSGNPLGVSSNITASPPSRPIAVLRGAVEEEVLRAHHLPLMVVPDAQTGRDAVANGVAAALALSAPTVHWMAAHDASGATVPLPGAALPGSAAGQGAFAFRRGDLELCRRWDEALLTLKRSGDYQTIEERFGFSNEKGLITSTTPCTPAS